MSRKYTDWEESTLPMTGRAIRLQCVALDILSQFCLLFVADINPVRRQTPPTHPTDPPDSNSLDGLLSDLQSICILILLYETSLVARIRYMYLGGGLRSQVFLGERRLAHPDRSENNYTRVSPLLLNMSLCQSMWNYLLRWIS